jgi:ABC-type glycerol-3-phosphate transport system substrate-binding protein
MARTLSFHHFVGNGREGGMERLVEAFSSSQSQVMVEARELTKGLSDDATARLGLLPPYLGNAVPDVVMVYGEFVATLADQGRIRPLDEFIDGPLGIDTSIFVDRALEAARYRDQVWALPIEGNPCALLCNVRLLEQAGIGELPRTLGDVYEAAAMLTADTDGDGRSDRFGYAQCSFQVPLLMWQFGAELMSEDLTRVTFDSEEGMQALKFHADLRTYSPPHSDFERGDVGMSLGTVEDYFSRRYEHLDIEIVPLPRGRRAANAFGGADGALCLAIACREPECEEAAWRFLRWLTTQQGLMEWVRTTASIPLVRSVLHSDEYQEFVAQWPKLRPFIAQLGICRARPCIPEYPVVKWAIEAAAIESRRDGCSCSGDRAREVLRRCAAQAQAALDRRVKV